MSPPGLIFLEFLGVFGWIIVALIFASSAMRDGSLRVGSRKGAVEFRKRLGGRVFGVMMSVWVMTSFSVVFWMGVSGNAQRHHTTVVLSTSDYLALFAGLWMTGAFSGLMLFLAGPNDVSLDLDRRTYRFVSGWPVFPQVQTGS